MTEELTKARKKAMNLLAGREQSRAELLRKLEKAGFGSDVAGEVVRRLSDEGLQSDPRFVESFVQSRIRQGKGPVRIRAELGERGLPAELVDEALDVADADWIAIAREVRKRKFGAGVPADFSEKARQMRFLQYRGFEPEQIRHAVSATEE